MPRPPLTLQAVTLTLVPLVCAVGVAGNTMVVPVVARSRHMVTSTNCYLVSLAPVELLVLLVAGVLRNLNISSVESSRIKPICCHRMLLGMEANLLHGITHKVFAFRLF